jgi:glutamate-1-semialdehyde aminotransferase
MLYSMEINRYKNSTAFLGRAELSIPLGSQTFSKSRLLYPPGIAPLFIEKAKGAYVWDIDKNRYIDLVNSLAAVTIGYCFNKIDKAVRTQLNKGTIFSLPGKLEAEVAELIQQTVPSAEMVRFAKNGSDVTSAAIRLARAYTGKDEVAFCGYHGWQDWYIGATNRNKGVPIEVSKLSHKFSYNDLNSLEEIFRLRSKKIAAVIMEPMNSTYPQNEFLENVKRLTHKEGAILVFDETITGFRFSTGGAQQEFAVTPDLTTLGKGIANGYPLSAIVGKREIMMEMENVFFSGTFGGELLSLAAAKVVLGMHLEANVSKKLVETGNKIASSVKSIIADNALNDTLFLSGHPSWIFLNWKSTHGVEEKVIKTFFMQEMFKRGVLVLSTHNVSFSYNQSHIKKLIEVYAEVLSEVSLRLNDGSLENLLMAEPVEQIFKVR